jgi:hypothetical protein
MARQEETCWHCGAAYVPAPSHDAPARLVSAGDRLAA